MNPLGLYEPGTSPLHRAPAGAKLVALLVVVTAAVLLRTPPALAGPAALVVVGYAVARVPARRLGGLLRTVVPVVVLLFAVQAWLLGAAAATVLGLRLAVTLGAATLFTLTTRVDAVVAAVERGLGPLRRFGVRPDRVGLVVGLTVAAIGTLSIIAGEVREAARARGADRSATAFVVPFLVRTLRHADALGEALAARGVGDDPPDDQPRPGGDRG
ncbi:MAG TPA: energy-coupling factor transporter transmembrane protein EcfT [Pseudonocardia sp.]|nr:energy-coupling factor transporter transmembrane protein EcfT [Pseudonocardia sp.]